MPSHLEGQFHVAIIGGGLCGLALAIALRHRGISFKIYEARASFTELGAGINVGPNSYTAFQLIDKSLGEAFFKIASRNPPGKEEVYLDIRLGAPIGGHEDGEVVLSLLSPPTGAMTIGRNALLQLLAEKAGLADGATQAQAAFNKKLSRLDQTANAVEMEFEDGTTETASAAIACDGIHSAVRRTLLGPTSPAAAAVWSESGAYRALLPITALEKVLGADRAHVSQVIVGPQGYVIMYPTTAEMMNVGFWTWKKGPWTHREWLLPSQKAAMQEDFKDWGPAVQQIMALIDDPPFFATHHHAVQPEKHWTGRVCLIGDAAHSMPPHQGAGAGQAMEDAYVMAEVLASIDKQNPTKTQIEAAFDAYETVRRSRSQSILDGSVQAMHIWCDLFDEPVSEEKLSTWFDGAQERFEGIWYHDMAADAAKARKLMHD